MPKGIYIRTEKNKGQIPWNKGLTKETDERIQKYGEKISKARLKRKQELGYLNSPEQRKKIRERMKGKNNPMYGKTGENSPYYRENSFKWKGDKAGMNALHKWIIKYKPKPDVCDICHQKTDKNGSTILVLSNTKNHQYTRNFDDYQYVHNGCHQKYDNKRKQNKDN